MNGATALKKARTYTDDTANSLGSLKGAPCTVKSTTETDEGTVIVFEWTGTNGATQTSSIFVKNGKSVASAILDKTNNLILELSDSTKIDVGSIKTIKGDDGSTPTFTIGDVTTLDSDQEATVNITGTSKNPILNFGIPKGKDIDETNFVSTDEKVKLNSSSADSKYLEELLDNNTIVVDTLNGVIKVITLDGLETTVATLNFIKNLDKDIMLYLNSISNPMEFKGVVATDDDLNTITNAESGNTYIVQSSASNSDKTMTFVYNGIDFVSLAETTIEVRDFLINPIDLSTEVTGVLSETKIDTAIARLSEVLTKELYGGSDDGVVKYAETLKELTYTVQELNDAIKKSHEHLNKSILDKIIENGLGNRILTDSGLYKELIIISSTEPEDKYVFWIDNAISAVPLLKIYDGTDWIVLNNSSSTSNCTLATVDDIKNLFVKTE